jgi:Spy/CpxP family protein refolding chaperone
MKKILGTGYRGFREGKCMSRWFVLMTSLPLLILLSLYSCSSMPFTKKEPASEAGGEKKVNKVLNANKENKGELVVEENKDPNPGDIRTINGIEYIYARNRKYLLYSGEPENVWIRKDQHSPGFVESIVTSATAGGKNERDAMEQRIARLEEDLKKSDISRLDDDHLGPGTFGGNRIGPLMGPGSMDCSAKLNLAKEQMEKIWQMNEQFYNDTRAMRYDLFQKQMELKTVYSDPKADDTAILAKQKEVGAAKQKIDEKMIQFNLAQRKVLTLEQLKRLGEIGTATGCIGFLGEHGRGGV